MLKVKIPDFKFPLQKPVDWLDRPFRHVEEIFPEWPEAREVLSRSCELIGGWDIHIDSSNLHIVISSIAIDGPSIPENEKSKLREIAEGVIYDYSPDFEKYKGEKNIPSIRDIILGDIMSREAYIMSITGRDMKDEFRYRTGISC